MIAEGLAVPEALFHMPVELVKGVQKVPIPVLFENRFQPFTVFIAILIIAFIWVLVRYLVQTNSISNQAKNIGVMPFRT